MNNWKETTLAKGKKKSQFVFFDFFVDDIKFTSGEIIDPKKSKITTEVIKVVVSEVRNINVAVEIKIQDFGRGASWPMAVVEFMSKNDTVNALANLGGLIGLVQLFGGMFKILKGKYKNIKIGFKSAELLALVKVLKQGRSNIQNFKVVFRKEIIKSTVGFDEKIFVFIIRRGESDFFIMLDWNGKIKIFSKI